VNVKQGKKCLVDATAPEKHIIETERVLVG
jgi:hypothetical protein